jgi:adenosylhomocysteine nucleosidase
MSEGMTFLTVAPVKFVVLISANAEWRAVKELRPSEDYQSSPLGEWFGTEIAGQSAVFFHGGWGKIAAAASAQYVIDRWQPSLVVNLGTAGGFAGAIQTGEVILVEETLVYDIIEQMGDYQQALDHYTTRLDLSWLPQPYPQPVRRARLVSADRDILLADIPMLREKFSAVAADWESGAIAWVAQRNGIRCLILRAVTDLVSASGGEAYGAIEVFHARARTVMAELLHFLPEWVGG